MKILFSLLPLVIFSSCSQVSQPQPFPSNYQAKVKNHLQYKLYDPDSAKYQFTKPKLGKTMKGELYGMAFLVNAKNRFGGYTGNQQYFASFIDGEVYSADPNPLAFANQ